jgi:YHS domain-containing protein
MKRTKWIAVAVVTAFFLVGSLLPAHEAQSAGAPQTECPVMGNPINKAQFVDHQGKRIYFCCSSCKEDFKKDPGKYMKKMQAEGIVLEDVKSK